MIVAPLLPKVTPVTLARFVPVILTRVPAAVGPDAGEMPVTVGAGIYVYEEVESEPPGVVTA